MYGKRMTGGKVSTFKETDKLAKDMIKRTNRWAKDTMKKK